MKEVSLKNQEVLGKYEEVKSSLEEAIKKSDDIELAGEEENAELSYIRETLDKLNSEFKAEIERLENSAVCANLNLGHLAH